MLGQSLPEVRGGGGQRNGKGNRCWCVFVWHVVRAAICLTCDVWQTEFTQVPLPEHSSRQSGSRGFSRAQQMPSK